MNRFLFALLLLCHSLLSAQEQKGILLNRNTLRPVTDCIVIIKGKTISVITDELGSFPLPTEKANVTLVFTLLGYNTAEYDLSKYQKDTFFLTPKNVLLKEVAVTADKKSILNPGNSESVLDFDLLNDDLLILTAGDHFNELRLTEDTGQPLCRLKVNAHTDHLKHDCIGNLDLFSPDSVWQIFYDYTRLNALKPYPADTFQKVLGNCVCMNNKNYYFKTDSYRNLRTNYFYYNEDAKGERNELIAFQDSAKIRDFELDYDLQYFLKVRRESHYSMYNEPLDVMIRNMEHYREELPLDWAYLSWLGKMETQMFRSDTSVLIADFTDTTILEVSRNNQVKYHCPMSAYRKGFLRHVYVDAESGEVYFAGFELNTLTFIRFDISNGKKLAETFIPGIPYAPKKIIIKGGNAFFIQKNLADEQVYKIIRYSLN